MKVRNLIDLAALRVRQLPDFDAAELFRELHPKHRRQIDERIVNAMTPTWLAKAPSPQRFAAFVALPSGLRSEVAPGGRRP